MKKFLIWFCLFLAILGLAAGWYLVYVGGATAVAILALYCSTIVVLTGILQAL